MFRSPLSRRDGAASNAAEGTNPIRPAEETEMPDRTDPAAFRAAYNALMAYVPLAQVRGDVAERVAQVVVERRTVHGLGYMQALAESADERAATRLGVLAEIPQAFTTVTALAVDAAVKAAARALWDGVEEKPQR